MLELLSEIIGFVNAKISSDKLDVASAANVPSDTTMQGKIY